MMPLVHATPKNFGCVDDLFKSLAFVEAMIIDAVESVERNAHIIMDSRARAN